MGQNRKNPILLFLLILLVLVYIVVVYLYIKNKKVLETHKDTKIEINKTVFPLIENNIGIVSFDCQIDKIIDDKIVLRGQFIALLSAECNYKNVVGDNQMIQIPLVVKGPNGNANIDGSYYENFNWEEMGTEELINIFRINYWLQHTEKYDNPESWINGGNGKGVIFGKNDIIRVRLASSYSSTIFQNPGYQKISNFGKSQRQSIYTEDSYIKFLNTGNLSHLEQGNQINNLPKNYLWSDNIIKYIFIEDN